MTIDDLRAYWDRRPCNVRHSDQPIGTRGYFDEVERRRYFVESHIPAFAEFERWKGKRVLEVGCGIGTDTISFARAGASVIAIDLSPVAVELTDTRIRAYGYQDRVRVFCADIERPWASEYSTYPFGHVEDSASFDIVYVWGVLHHTPDPDRALNNIWQFLKPGGTLKVMIYHTWSWKNLLIKLRLAQPEAQSGCPVFRTYSKRQARAMLERHGFAIERMAVEHIFPWKVREYVQYHYVKAWPWKIVPDRLFRWLEHRMGWHVCIMATKKG